MFNAISRIFSASFLFEEVNGESAVGSSKFCHAIYQFRPLPPFSIILGLCLVCVFPQVYGPAKSVFTL